MEGFLRYEFGGVYLEGLIFGILWGAGYIESWSVNGLVLSRK